MSRGLAAAATALALLAAIVVAFAWLRPLDFLTRHVPPVEALAIERVALLPEGIAVQLRADGSEPLRIVQVQVDGAYWSFEQDPAGLLPRLSQAEILIPYPWVEGAAHHLVFVTATGVTFEHTVEVALPTPTPDAPLLAAYGLVGFLVGVVPVALGMLFYPLLRQVGPRGVAFALSLTVGLLVFLLIDTLDEGLEAAAAAAPALQAPAVVWLSALLAALVLLAVGRRGGRPPRGVALAVFVALGIGLHNLGEGLAIGAAFATGEAALASFLVLGFTLHNVSEGVGIAAPLVDHRPRLALFAGLALVAGVPAMFGTWAGAFAFSPLWVALCFGVAAGAILQVVIEVTSYAVHLAGGGAAGALGWTNVAGFAVGIAVMYATALLVPL